MKNQTNLKTSNSNIVNHFIPSNHPDMFEIDKEYIISQYERYSDEERNEYEPIVTRANIFITYGLTPAFMTDETGQRIVVTSKEYLAKRFN